MQIKIRGATDTGKRRKVNEDNHAWWIPDGERERRQRGLLLVLADGMGGAQAGEQASFLAVQTVVDCYRRAAGEDLLQELRSAVETANEVIYDEACNHEQYTGMGTTCTAAVILDRELLIVHVGDSRAYKIDEAGISPVTRDHSLVAEMVHRGELRPDQIWNHPRRNVVTRAVGIRPQVEVDVEQRSDFLSPGEILLLCSDGLHGVVTEREIWTIIQATPPENAAQALIDAANDKGGPDNITAVLAWISSDPPKVEA